MAAPKLLVDENLSPRVAAQLCARSVDATSVRDRGLIGAADPAVFAYAQAEDRAVVTVNAGDFRKLAAGADLHCGVIVLEEGDLSAAEQFARVWEALAWLEPNAHDRIVNHVLHIEGPGSFRLEPLPP